MKKKIGRPITLFYLTKDRPEVLESEPNSRVAKYVNFLVFLLFTCFFLFIYFQIYWFSPTNFII